MKQPVNYTFTPQGQQAERIVRFNARLLLGDRQAIEYIGREAAYERVVQLHAENPGVKPPNNPIVW